MPERLTHMVHVPQSRAVWLINVPALVGNGHRAEAMQISRDTWRVWLSTEALAVLEDFSEDDDGMFDGTSIWIHGTDYEVSRP